MTIQKDGLAMGSPPAPSLANIWLAKREPTIRDEAKFFERYMDDVIRSIKQHLIDEKMVVINNIHNNLKFTVELEKEGKIAFISMLLIRNERKLTSTWYCKPTDTGLVMNFHALAPRRYKRAVVSGFVHRIHQACSTWKNFHESLQRAKGVLEKNQYPPPFYEPIIEETISKLASQPNVDVEAAEKKSDGGVQQTHRLLLQYRGAVTDQFAKRMKACGAPMQVVLTLRKLRSYLPSLKPPVPKMLKSNIIYKISCSRCQACYVGKTSRHVCSRFAEHRTRKSEPVYKHLKSCGLHAPDLTEKDIEILASVTKGPLHLAITEALYIRELNPALNTRDEYRDHELTIKF